MSMDEHFSALWRAAPAVQRHLHRERTTLQKAYTMRFLLTFDF